MPCLLKVMVHTQGERQTSCLSSRTKKLWRTIICSGSRPWRFRQNQQRQHYGISVVAGLILHEAGTMDTYEYFTWCQKNRFVFTILYYQENIKYYSATGKPKRALLLGIATYSSSRSLGTLSRHGTSFSRTVSPADLSGLFETHKNSNRKEEEFWRPTETIGHQRFAAIDTTTRWWPYFWALSSHAPFES